MTTIWLVPLVVTTVGLLLIAGFARRTVEEADRLQHALRLAVVEIRDGIQRLR